jgi:hypothetical protein
MLFQAAAQQDLHLATFRYPARLLQESWPGVIMDQDFVICLRSVLMKPEHEDWAERIWSILDQITDDL